MTTIKTHCHTCDSDYAYTGRTLDEVRRMDCPVCGKRMTVKDVTPPAWKGSPPMPEAAPEMSKEYRGIVNARARRLLAGILDGE